MTCDDVEWTDLAYFRGDDNTFMNKNDDMKWITGGRGGVAQWDKESAK